MNFESDFSRLLKEHFCRVGQKYIVKKSKNDDCCNIIREKDHCDIKIQYLTLIKFLTKCGGNLPHLIY